MVKWNRSNEGFVESKCGRFTISPEYWGRESAQSYELKEKQTGKRYRFQDTQSVAKSKADFITVQEKKEAMS